MFFHSTEELKQRLVSISLEKRGEFFDTFACEGSEFGRLLKYFGYQILHSRCSSLILLHILIENRSEAHNLLLRQTSLLADTGKTGGEVDKIAGRSTTALSQFVNDRTRSQHCATQAFGLVVTEHLGQLAYIFNRIVAKVVVKRYINLIGGIYKLTNSLLGSNAKTASITCELIEFFARSTSIHLLK